MEKDLLKPCECYEHGCNGFRKEIGESTLPAALPSTWSRLEVQLLIWPGRFGSDVMTKRRLDFHSQRSQDDKPLVKWNTVSDRTRIASIQLPNDDIGNSCEGFKALCSFNREIVPLAQRFGLPNARSTRVDLSG
jgi:hypothetical protein